MKKLWMVPAGLGVAAAGWLCPRAPNKVLKVTVGSSMGVMGAAGPEYDIRDQRLPP